MLRITVSLMAFTKVGDENKKRGLVEVVEILFGLLFDPLPCARHVKDAEVKQRILTHSLFLL